MLRGPITRRYFVSCLGGAAAAWPLAARAQKESRAGKVGILMAFPESDRDIQARVTAFRRELRKVGWSEGVNLHIDERWPSDDMGRVRTDAAELLNLKPDVILVSGRRAVAVLQQQTRSIPVVFAGIGDPVETGLVASFAKPGGNFTGFTLWEYSVIGKMLGMLKEASLGMTRGPHLQSRQSRDCRHGALVRGGGSTSCNSTYARSHSYPSGD
jgi:ABC transporter substrate binding protein